MRAKPAKRRGADCRPANPSAAASPPGLPSALSLADAAVARAASVTCAPNAVCSPWKTSRPSCEKKGVGATHVS